ncbi:MAG TPA: hypothetical protein VMB34_03890 [Acetobacteraceae bacterium]|nr:hypothetical protein [Acetobacteraceae bacterium]
MIEQIFRGIKWLDAELRRRIGLTYNVVITIGLIIEIVRRMAEIGERYDTAARPLLALVLFALLLLNQLAELGEHFERYRQRRAAR